MKRSLRLPFSLLLLAALASLLLFRSALPIGFGSSLRPASVDPASVNSTFLSLATLDTNAQALAREVNDLLDGNLPSSTRPRYRRPDLSAWRRDNHIGPRSGSELRPSIRLRSVKDFRIFPEFRRSLRDWYRNRRFQPDVMSDLPDLTKRPLDLRSNAPELDKSSRLYNSCAVVGNSGILLKNEHGDLIDSHAFVIRLNNARIAGYSRHVGSKTSLSFVNSNILHLCARREGCFCHPYGDGVPMIMYICQPVHFLDYTTCNSSHKSALLITDPRFDLLCAGIVKYYSMKRFVEETGKGPEEWGKFHDEIMFHYSSGMQAVMLAVGICEKVSVFGFGKSSEAKHHYHTNQKVELDLHDYEAEYAFYRDLVERPQVIPFLGGLRFKVPPVVFYH